MKASFLPALSLQVSVGRESGEFLWFPFEKLSVLSQHSANTMDGTIRKVMKSEAV